MNNRIPLEIFELNKSNDVNIFIGENGSGKSTLLAEIANKFLNEKRQVVAIANSIHDKFEKRKNFDLLRGKGGRKQIKDIVKKAFTSLRNDDFTRLKNAIGAIEYVGYDPIIGFKLNYLNVNFDSSFDTDGYDLFNPSKIPRDSVIENFFESEIYSNIKTLITKIHKYENEEGIVQIGIGTTTFDEFEKSTLTEIFKYEKILVKARIIDSIEIFLSKKQVLIPLFSASSGELSLIGSIIYLSITIREGTIILIDEPENSLHPIWQKKYVKNLMDIFHYYVPKIIIATHSPLIISDSETSVIGTQVFKANGFVFTKQNVEQTNIEEIFYQLFDTVTPQNRYLSNFIVDLLNKLTTNEISFFDLETNIIKVYLSSYDDRQKILCSEILEIAKEISEK